jgi:4-amino-4-deoxy-L-arabinose transferase-like glycosyltransferase
MTWGNKGSSWAEIGALLALTCLLYLPGLGEMPMMDRDEPRFARATVEMMERGSWAVPYFNEEYRFDKPPLTYWWMALHYKLLGISELAARLHSVVAVWLVALILRQWRGLMTGIMWLVTFQVLIHGRLAVADMPMVLCVTLTMWATTKLPAQGKGWSRWHFILYASLGLGFLAKGPVAWLIPGLAVVLQRWVFWRKPLAKREWFWVRGGLLTLAIVALWGVPALIQTSGAYWSVGMGEHVVERGARAFNGRFPVPGYYLVTALLSLFPWVVLIPAIWKRWRASPDEESALLLSWFCAPYVIFSLYATQLPHYVMPGFPAFMLLGSAVLKEPLPRAWKWGVVGLWALIALMACGMANIGSWPAPLMPLIWHGAIFLTFMTLLGVLITTDNKAWLVMACMLAWETREMATALREVHAGVQLSVSRKVIAADELVAWGFTEPSLVFHFQHPWHFVKKEEAFAEKLASPDTRLALALRREWTLDGALKSKNPVADRSAELDALSAAHPEYVEQMKFFFNAARSSWVELLFLERK